MDTLLFPVHAELHFIKVWVKPGAKKDHIYGWVQRNEETVLKLSVRQPPENGRANAAVLDLVSQFLNISLSSLSLKTGAHCRLKGIAITR